MVLSPPSRTGRPIKWPTMVGWGNRACIFCSGDGSASTGAAGSPASAETAASTVDLTTGSACAVGNGENEANTAIKTRYFGTIVIKYLGPLEYFGAIVIECFGSLV